MNTCDETRSISTKCTWSQVSRAYSQARLMLPSLRTGVCPHKYWVVLISLRIQISSSKRWHIASRSVSGANRSRIIMKKCSCMWIAHEDSCEALCLPLCMGWGCWLLRTSQRQAYLITTDQTLLQVLSVTTELSLIWALCQNLWISIDRSREPFSNYGWLLCRLTYFRTTGAISEWNMDRGPLNIGQEPRWRQPIYVQTERSRVWKILSR